MPAFLISPGNCIVARCMGLAAGAFIRSLLVIALLAGAVPAADSPFDMSTNWGGTGLMEIPTARILPDGAMRLGAATAPPYVWYAFGFGLLPGLEFSARYTDITNLQSTIPSDDYGSFKDKAFDIKYQLFPESKGWPAIAVGVNDFQGTRMFESQYLVFSRQVYPLDFTLGVGRARLKGPLNLFDEVGFWGGVEWAVTDRLHLMVEYNPVEYQKDIIWVRGVPEGADLPLNVGLRYRTWFGLDLGLSYQRGDTLGLSAHFQFGLGRPILPPKPDPPSWRFAITPSAAVHGPDESDRRLCTAIEQAGFGEVKTETTGTRLVAEFENTRYLSDALAVGRVLRLMLLYAGKDTAQLTVVVKRGGLQTLFVSVPVDDARRFFMGDITAGRFFRLLSITPSDRQEGLSPPPAADTDAAAGCRGIRQWFSYGIDPALETYFNDPSGVFQFRLALKPYATLSLWPGGTLYGSFELPLYADVRSEVATPPDAVRSDSWKYLGSQATIGRLLFDQMVKLAPSTYARLSVGYLERMYAGAGGEVLTYLDQGRWALGVESDWVRKRAPDEPLGLTDQDEYTLLGNVYYRYLPLNVTMKAQIGRFLAGDVGVRLEFRRRFDTGAELGFWYSITDTSDLTGFNRGYNDYGIFLNLPFAVFRDRPTRMLLHYRVSPWTRDAGAAIYHWREIYDATADLTPGLFRRDLGRMPD